MKYTDLPTRIFWGSCITLIISKEPPLMLTLPAQLLLHRIIAQIQCICVSYKEATLTLNARLLHCTGSLHMRFL